MKLWKIFLSTLAITALGVGMVPMAHAADSTLSTLQFHSGGIGIENRRANSNGHETKLVFINERGEYFASVRVTFQQGGDKRSAYSAGPWLWVKGAPGTYWIEAQSGGAVSRKKIVLRDKGPSTIIFRLK
jgi:hypothetical protein